MTSVHEDNRPLKARFDWHDWLPYIEDQTIPDDQKRELIETLWLIVTSFVDLGWSVSDKSADRHENLDIKQLIEFTGSSDAATGGREKQDA